MPSPPSSPATPPPGPSRDVHLSRRSWRWYVGWAIVATLIVVGIALALRLGPSITPVIDTSR